MSLLSSYTSANKVESTALTVRYSVQLVDYTYYRVTRTAEKQYAYTGMTRAAAESCKLAKIAQYTRTYYKLSSEKNAQSVPLVYSYTDNKTTVTKTHGTGDSWNVNISVNEEDIRATKTAPTDPASLFSLENARDYDETAGVAQGITITETGYTEISGVGRITVNYSQTIDGFDRDGMILQFKRTESQQSWTNLDWTFASATSIVADEVTIDATAYLRLVYGGFVSSVQTVSPS